MFSLGFIVWTSSLLLSTGDLRAGAAFLSPAGVPNTLRDTVWYRVTRQRIKKRVISCCHEQTAATDTTSSAQHNENMQMSGTLTHRSASEKQRDESADRLIGSLVFLFICPSRQVTEL